MEIKWNVLKKAKRFTVESFFVDVHYGLFFNKELLQVSGTFNN